MCCVHDTMASTPTPDLWTPTGRVLAGQPSVVFVEFRCQDNPAPARSRATQPFARTRGPYR